jgi:RimJ/RimL family protein N-acetyltransferase
MEIVRLHNGSEAVIRPIRFDDGPRLSAAYDRLSPESRYRRFLTPKPHLSAAEVRYLVEIDGDAHVALVATPVDDPDRIIGVARFVRLAEDPLAAEFAIVVGDPWQGEGLGKKLLLRLTDAARGHGIQRLRATMLADNGPAHRLVHGVSPQASLRISGTIHEIDLDLAA